MQPKELIQQWVTILVLDGKIRFQRGYWDKLSFLRMHGLPIPILRNPQV